MCSFKGSHLHPNTMMWQTTNVPDFLLFLFFFSWSKCSSCVCNSSLQLLLSSCGMSREGSSVWDPLVPAVVKKGGCPRATLHRRIQSLKQSCWKVLASKVHVAQALPRLLMHQSVHIAQQDTAGRETLESWIYGFWQSIQMPWAKKHFC